MHACTAGLSTSYFPDQTIACMCMHPQHNPVLMQCWPCPVPNTVTSKLMHTMLTAE